MDAPTFENLDLACAKVGKTMAEMPSKKELENLVTSALAVLEEQGMYALFLFLETQTGRNKEISKDIRDELFKFLKVTPKQAPLLRSSSVYIFASLQQMAEDLDNLLLARDLVRQSLVYARYHARIQEKSEVGT